MILLIHILLFISIIPCFVIKYKQSRLNFIISAIVGFTFGMLGLSFTAAALTSAVLATVIYGGIAMSLMSKQNIGGLGNSPAYQAQLQTQANPDLPVPLLYGTVKLAGNRIWQNDTKESNIKRIVAFAEGEITDFTDIRLNDQEPQKVSGYKVEKFYGTSSQNLPSMVKLSDVGSLRNIAYLAITCKRTPKIDINYNLTTIVKGRKIRVYTTVNDYEIKYSENPAWILFDFLTSYNGLGIALNNSCEVDDNLVAQLFDLETFIESAAFCDEEIEYTDNEGNVHTTPRFTFNMIFDSQTSARDLIDEIYRSCRGGLFTHNGKLQFKIDKAEPVSQVFTEQDIIKGSETFQVIPAEEHYEILRVSYISPEHEWQKVEAFAEIPVYRYGAPIEHSVNLYSCTNFQQASRLAWYYVNSKALCPYFGSFQTDYRAYTLEVGDVIQIDSLLMGLNNYLVKVTSVKDDGSGVFTVNWRNYDERLYNDTLGCQEPRVIVSDLSDISAYPADVRNFNVIQVQNLFSFVWSLNDELTDTYEIRYGESWESGVEIGRNITSNTYTWEIPQIGLYKFWIKAFNRYNYSQNPTLDVLDIDSILGLNTVVNINVLDNMQGVFNNTYEYHNTLKLAVNNVLWQTTTNKWGEDTYYQNNGLWGANVVSEGSYASQVYDIGDSMMSIMKFDSDYITSDNTQEVVLEWRYSDDNINWSEWIICSNDQFNFRYCQFRVTLYAINNIPIVFNRFNVTVDVPDKEINMEVVIPAETGELEIEYDFNSVPSIIGTVNDNIEAYVVVTEKTETRATIKAYLNDGGTTGANVNLRLKGY